MSFWKTKSVSSPEVIVYVRRKLTPNTVRVYLVCHYGSKNDFIHLITRSSVSFRGVYKHFSLSLVFVIIGDPREKRLYKEITVTVLTVYDSRLRRRCKRIWRKIKKDPIKIYDLLIRLRRNLVLSTITKWF